MKIGIDARLWGQTGVGRYLEELVENLVKIDRENYYILFLRKEHQNLPLPGPIWQKRITDIRWHSLKEQILLPFILWREHLDLVHFPYFSVPIFYPGKFVVTIHDLILDHFDTGKASTLPWFIYKMKRLGYKLVMWIALHRAVKIITVSEATKKEMIDHYKINPDKIVVTYEAAIIISGTQGVKRTTPLRCEGKSGKYFLFLYVGNAYPHKNLERLLEAVSIIHHPSSIIYLLLVGGEDYFYKRLKAKVKEMELEDVVVFWGPAGREELANLYKNAIALVFPSLMEGFGLPAVEAMSHGCLVLCSDIPVFHEVLGEAAIYFNPHDPDDIAQKMEAAFIYNTTEHEKYEEMKRKGFEQVKKYSWKKLAEETLAVYQSVLK